MSANKGWKLQVAGGAVIAENVEIATSLWRRALGLMFRAAITDDYGLVLKPCSSIHMFFMRFPIDVLFVDGDGKVLKVLHAIRPWRMSLPVWGSKAAIELAAGKASRAGVLEGTKVELLQP